VMQVIEKKQSIGLVGMEFYAHHGYYEEEQKIGGQYTVDIYIQYEAEFSEDKLENTINYEIVYQVVKNQMAISSKLIEHIGEQIIIQLKKILPDHHSVKVIIKKHRPPLKGIVNYAIFEIEM